MKDTIVHVHIHGLKSRGDGVCVVVRSHGERPPEVEDIVVFNYLFFMSGMNFYSIFVVHRVTAGVPFSHAGLALGVWSKKWMSFAWASPSEMCEDALPRQPLNTPLLL